MASSDTTENGAAQPIAATSTVEASASAMSGSEMLQLIDTSNIVESGATQPTWLNHDALRVMDICGTLLGWIEILAQRVTDRESQAIAIAQTALMTAVLTEFDPFAPTTNIVQQVIDGPPFHFR
jgi:hypothetical protein